MEKDICAHSSWTKASLSNRSMVKMDSLPSCYIFTGCVVSKVCIHLDQTEREKETTCQDKNHTPQHRCFWKQVFGRSTNQNQILKMCCPFCWNRDVVINPSLIYTKLDKVWVSFYFGQGWSYFLIILLLLLLVRPLLDQRTTQKSWVSNIVCHLEDRTNQMNDVLR